jgi:hypothetical protein
MTIIADVPLQLHKPFIKPSTATDSLLPSLVVHANISSTSTKQLLLQADTHTETDSGGYKRTESYHHWRREVGAILLEYGLEKEARKFYDCAERPVRLISSKQKAIPDNAATVWVCSDNPNHDAALFMPTCSLRICPDCAARQTARFAARYIPKCVELAMQGGSYRLRHIVFTTTVDLTSDTPENIRKQVNRFAKLPKRALNRVAKIGKKLGRDWATLGCIQSYEFGTDGLKLHFHIIHYGAYIPQKELSEQWHKVTKGNASVVFIRAIDNSSAESVQNDVIETLKYSVKFWKRDSETNEVQYLPVNVMPHLLMVLKRSRRVKSWGVFYDLPEIKKEKFKCESCQSNMLRVGVDYWQTWIEMLEAAHSLVERIDSFLHSKLANKSGFSSPDGNKPPPDKTEISGFKRRKRMPDNQLSLFPQSHYDKEDKF